MRDRPPNSRHRLRTLHRIEQKLEPVMVVLGFTWLVLLILEFVDGLPAPLERLRTAIWLAFVAEFALRFIVAPRKLRHLRSNWLTLLALALPALRIFRALRALRLIQATRGLRLVRLLTSMNRSLGALGRAMQRRGAGYVGVLTVLVTFAGAAGMLAFEGRGAASGFSGYAEALWWTAMLITTVGSEYWPGSPEGRILALLLSIYAMGVFGYLAATLASIFIGQETSPGQQAPVAESLKAIRGEIRQLRAELGEMRRAPDAGDSR